MESVSEAKEKETNTGYCVKCKTKREIKDAKKVTFKNGKPGITGICVKCGTKMVKIGGSGKKK